MPNCRAFITESSRIDPGRSWHRTFADVSIFYSLFRSVLRSKYLQRGRVLIVGFDMLRLIALLYMVYFYVEPLQKLMFLKKFIIVSDVSL